MTHKRTTTKLTTKAAYEPRDIFMHAYHFHESDHRLRDTISSKNLDQVAIIAHPSMVLSAFASELYLKCLLCIETGSVPKGHNLRDLFLRLDASTRKHIDDLWDEELRRPHKQRELNFIRGLPGGDQLQTNLSYVLEISAKGFEELRYIYETDCPRFLLGEFPNILHKVILERHPEWRFPPPTKHVVRVP
jgi:hypothetical protein